jgi:hypothetical protein
MEKAELRKEWERRISVFRASGQTQAKWCAANDLKEHQLKYWLKRIEGSNSKQKLKTQWAPVSIEEAVEEPNETIPFANSVNLKKTGVKINGYCQTFYGC